MALLFDVYWSHVLEWFRSMFLPLAIVLVFLNVCEIILEKFLPLLVVEITLDENTNVLLSIQKYVMDCLYANCSLSRYVFISIIFPLRSSGAGMGYNPS